MSPYAAPLAEIRFALRHLGGLGDHGDAAAPELVDAVLDEAARLAGEVIAPTNRAGDREGARLVGGVVTTPTGFKDAYAALVQGGWNGLAFPVEHGGQGLPALLAIAVQEMWHSANMALALCPLLTQAAVHLLLHHGSPAQKRLYLPKLVTGEWTGTMNLTEPQAGSDLGALRMRAVRDGERYLLTGQKIFITYGDHDLAENIVHMVLARIQGAPPGPKGISLFLAPKIMVDDAGKLLAANDVRVVSLEHKLGIHGSPTAVMAYGDGGGATGFLVGEENRGLEAMFVMMNNARLAIGVQGLAVAERAYQQARAYAATRLQGRAPDGAGPAAILKHPDIRRMLVTMKARIEAARGLTYIAADALDSGRHRNQPDRLRLGELLTPVVKAWCTDMGVEVASAALQVQGGMGYIEETGAAQHYRDARIAPIYEGTNGIQANDLVLRKLGRDGGEAARRFIGAVALIDAELAARDGPDFAAIRAGLSAARADLAAATEWMVAALRGDAASALAGAVPYLKLFGTVGGGFAMARSALAAERLRRDGADRFLDAKIGTARFYAEHILPLSAALRPAIVSGAASALAFPEEIF